MWCASHEILFFKVSFKKAFVLAFFKFFLLKIIYQIISVQGNHINSKQGLISVRQGWKEAVVKELEDKG